MERNKNAAKNDDGEEKKDLPNEVVHQENTHNSSVNE